MNQWICVPFLLLLKVYLRNAKLKKKQLQNSFNYSETPGDQMR